MTQLENIWNFLGKPGILIAGAIFLGLLIQIIAFKIAGTVSSKTQTSLDNLIIRYTRAPFRILLPLIFVNLVIPSVQESASKAEMQYIDKLLAIMLIIGIAWLLMRLTLVLQDFLLDQYRTDVRDNLKARKIHTQIDVMRKIVSVIIIIIALAAVLMNFEKFRELGTGLLASAGVAGLVIGFAAQKTLSNLLAGIQIAITQPIRNDDVVVVEGEWGWIEEITLTYVVVRIWDLRRLILPISYFLEHPFQNWTRESADILGTVYLYVDYTVPIAKIRDELHRILEQSEYWDGKVWRLHTTNTSEKTVELRALMSTADSPTAWELRCEVREKLVEFIRENYPEALPKLRTEIGGTISPGDGTGAAAFRNQNPKPNDENKES